MKKALVLLLALAMLLPMVLAQPAKAAAEPDKPFYALSWNDFDQKTYPNLDGLHWLRFSNIGDTIRLDDMVAGRADLEEQALAAAQKVKKIMDARPAGARYIHTFKPAAMYRLAPENALFMDHAVDQMVEILDMFLKKYKEIGGLLDGVVVDVEYIGLSTYYLIDNKANDEQENTYVSNPNLLREIVADPRYKTEIRPLLEEWGFIFYEADTPEKQASYTELYSVTKNAGTKYARSRQVWDTVMRIHLNRYVTKWAYEPVKKYFPDANVSDYQSTDTDTWLKMSSVTDDGTEMNGGNSIKSGDTSTYSFYYNNPKQEYYDSLKKYTGYNDAVYPATAYSTLLYEVNFGKYMYESTDTHKIAPWITSYMYGGKSNISPAYTPLYSELLYHLGLLDPQPFLSYTYKQDYTSDGWIKTQQTMNEIMAELTRVAGYSDREPIMTPLDWNSEYILSGMYAGGRNIWRITPNTNVVSLEAFKVKDSDPTFTVEGKTVTFPGGKIIADATISNVGTCGYWIETAKDVMPVVTTGADRYEKYPSVSYNFEEYAEGKFDYNTSKPKNAWGFTWKKFGDIQGASNIVTVGGNKKLSIIGNSKNWLKELPTNITAGDSYAEDQAWELTVTIPEGLSKDAQINILTYKGKNQEIDDGGFMVKGGKLYYATGEEDEEFELVYAEMMDIKPGTYKFKRVMNFHFMESTIYSTYIVMDASGKELKKVENIPSPTFDYITEVGFAVSSADKAVIVDDFKLYVTGVTTDFGIYDAKTGQTAALNATRNSDTAYRLSWLNATAKEETVTIKADITSGGKTTTKTLHEVKLQPGNDSVVTGIVEVKEGETVKVYLETSVKAPVEPTKPVETEPTQAPTEAPQVTEGTKAPTQATSSGTRPTTIKVTKATEPVEEPTEAPTKAPTQTSTQASTEETVAPTEETLAPTEETLAPTEETQAPTEETQAPTEETQAPTEPTKATTPADKDDEGGPNVVLIVVIVAVVLAAAGAGVYFFVIKKKKA